MGYTCATHYDISSAYLKAYKEEDFENNVRVPEGISIPDEELRRLGANDCDDVCLLVKSLYELNQAGRLWNQLLHQTLLQAGFTQSVTDA